MIKDCLEAQDNKDLFGDDFTYNDVMSIASALDDTSIPHTIDLNIFKQLNNYKLKDYIWQVGVVFY